VKIQEFIHTIIALIMVFIFDQFKIGIVGAVLASAFFAGREHAQAEYRWIEHCGNGKRVNMKWWNAFDPRVWDAHSWFWNLIAPICASFTFVFFKG
jgi:hypothetical protein